MTNTDPKPSWTAHVLAPVVVLLLAAPVALQPQMYLIDPDGDRSGLATRVFILTPFWVGLAAGPGYLWAIHVVRKGLQLESGEAMWIRASLLLATLACIGGIVATWTSGLPIFPIGSAISLMGVLHIGYLFWRSRSDREPRLGSFERH